jgi:hypothetical protein
MQHARPRSVWALPKSYFYCLAFKKYSVVVANISKLFAYKKCELRAKILPLCVKPSRELSSAIIFVILFVTHVRASVLVAELLLLCIAATKITARDCISYVIAPSLVTLYIAQRENEFKINAPRSWILEQESKKRSECALRVQILSSSIMRYFLRLK